MRKAVLMSIFAMCGMAQQTQQSLLVTRIYNITPTWAGECAPNTLENTSALTRLLNYFSYYATGSGTWSVDMQYSDTTCTGLFASFGGPAVVTQTSGTGIGVGVGYHPFVKFVITGNAKLNFSGEKDFYILPGGSGGGGGGGGVLGEQIFTSSSGQTAFTTTFSLNPTANTMVYHNGVKVIFGVTNDYTISGNSVNFNLGLPAGDLVDVVQFGGSGGGGGGGGNACNQGVNNQVPFSAGPTFNLSTAATQSMILTGTVVSPVFMGMTPYCTYQVYLCQDSIGGHVFNWPSNVQGPMANGQVAGKCSMQSFLATDASHLSGASPGLLNF